MAHLAYRIPLYYFIIYLLWTQIQANPVQYEITEERDPGTHIGNIKLDSGLSDRYTKDQLAAVSYHLIPNAYSRYFSLDSHSGDLETADILDRDLRDVCRRQAQCLLQMQVAARGGAIFQLIRVHITIQDMNDNPPKFDQPHIVSSLPESTGPGVLFPIQPAQDPDSPTFGVKRYELVDNIGIFRLQVNNDTSGSVDLQLILEDELDRETEDHYKLKVVAYDGGRTAQAGSVTIDITVLDENDNIPTFDQSTYDVSIAENFGSSGSSGSSGSVIIQLQAADPDLGVNGIVTYSFDEKTSTIYGNTFGINSATGEIFLKRRLDYRQMSLYSLGVAAQNQGAGSFPSYAKVFIHVEDVNDHWPAIAVDANTQSGQVEVKEHAGSDTFVAHISVSDQDDDKNGEVSCSLQDLSDSFKVQNIVDTEFKILTKHDLDREVQDSYDITFHCHDNGSPKLSSSTVIEVHVMDINDHKPVFSQTHYGATLEENNRAREVIIQVSATDEDLGKNGEIRYYLTADSGNILNIDPKSGVITAKISFDREHLKKMEFQVIAKDQGEHPLNSSAVVELTISDLNDEPPVFTKSRYSFSIAEDTELKSKVGVVLAEDADLPGNNELSYYIDEEYSIVDMFSINPLTGSIFTEAMLDRETNDEYELIVVAKSDSVPHTSSSAVVVVHVVDVNDNSPIINFPKNGENNTFVISTQVPVGYSFLSIKAEDDDDGINSELTYSISEGNENSQFIIEPKRGHILVNADLSESHGASFPLIVTVTDSGSPRLKAVTTLTIVVDENVLYPDPAFTSEEAGGLSTTHMVVVICVVVGSFLVAMFLVVAILVVRRRGKLNNNHSKQERFYVAKSADIIPNDGAGQEAEDEAYNISRDVSKISDLTDITYNDPINVKVQ